MGRLFQYPAQQRSAEISNNRFLMLLVARLLLDLDKYSVICSYCSDDIFSDVISSIRRHFIESVTVQGDPAMGKPLLLSIMFNVTG